jgi:hydrogenase-4 component E
MTPTSEILIKILFVLILGTASLIIMQKTLTTLFSVYGIQSFLIAAISYILFRETGSYVLLVLAILTLLTKVIIIPYMLNKIRVSGALKRDNEFRYLTPVSAILVGIALIVIVYTSFSRIFDLSKDNLFFLGAVIGVSLCLMGMLVIFSRKKVVTKVVGYLNMENGILLLQQFWLSELNPLRMISA